MTFLPSATSNAKMSFSLAVSVSIVPPSAGSVEWVDSEWYFWDAVRTIERVAGLVFFVDERVDDSV
jgi:hypothetical protein